MRNGLLTLVGLVLGVAFQFPVAALPSEIVVESRNCELLFSVTNGRVKIVHFGEKGAESVGAWTSSPSISVQGSDGASRGGLAVTHTDGCLSLDLRLQSEERLTEHEGVEEVRLHFKDSAYDFRVCQHFCIYKEEDVVETWLDIRNEEPGCVRLRRMNSLSWSFPMVAARHYVQYSTGDWACEGHLREMELKRGADVVFGSLRGTYSAFEANPSFMLSFGERPTEEVGCVLGCALAWSGMWKMSVGLSQNDGLRISAGVATDYGDYVLDKGLEITLPKVILTWSSGGKGQVSRNFHRWARNWQMPNARKLRPIVLNNWEGTQMAFDECKILEIMDGARDLGVELFVLDDGWFGRGRNARNDDSHGLGDWYVNEAKLPHGLQGLASAARERGLEFGFWVEPEMANLKSDFYERHPELVLQEPHRPLRGQRGGTQVVVDFANPVARDEIWRMLESVYASVPNLSYVKWDANASMIHVGSGFLDRLHQSNLPFDYTKGVYSFLKRQRKVFPGVDIQDCASGGGRMDYGMLAFTDEFWTSDDTDPRERVMIQWAASQFYPACAMAAHVTTGWNRPASLKFRTDVAMSGRFGYELQPSRMTRDELEYSKAAVSTYKRIRSVVQHGDLYRLVSPFENDYAALMYVQPDASHAVVFAYGLSRRVGENQIPPLRLFGLDSSKRYVICELNKFYPKSTHLRGGEVPRSGSSLMVQGLPLCLSGNDYDSAVIELREE